MKCTEKELNLREDEEKRSVINANRQLREKAAQSWVYAAKPPTWLFSKTY
jgi:hypothetical protein